MANYKVAPAWAMEIVNQAESLCQRRIILARCNFPLTSDRVQRMLVPQRALDILVEFEGYGGSSVRKIDDVYFTTPIGAEGITRRVMLNIEAVNPKIYYARDGQSGGDRSTITQQVRAGKISSTDADLSVLTDTERAALATWVNGAVREYRLKELTMRAVREFKNLREDLSVYMLLARWPTLATLLERTNPNMWKHKIQSDIPKNLSRWGWESDSKWYEANKKLIQAADTVLVGAMMMPVMEIPKTMRGLIRAWEKLEGDNF